ncbi:DUF1240 domain-containing protein [Photorhabdus khanii]|uniref:DUF1240 domain-containing protein n=1 Tax=Photorhabdus khanii subsp. guanajuatensis TaxID=2100166 RepID=A0A4R4IX48_9GAMM|nr:DUF1240 domain-containing protein [Photorhabdus khanii]TDB45570.1 hypothetical protein C5467_21755 [Photorhabdus khanii subsp. guanajuatensis]
MDNKRKIINVIGAIFVLSLVSLGMFAAVDGLFSLITMAEVISFSNGIIIAFFSFPLVFYFLSFVIYFNLTARTPKYHDICVNCLGMIAIVAFFLSFPTAFYVNYKLKNENYSICPKISWSSPNKYVKDIKLCD